MGLSDYLRVGRKRWRLMLAVIVAVVGVALVVTVLTPRSYAATTRMFVSTSGADGSALLQGGSFTQQRVKSYADVITTPAVLGPVIDRLRLTTTPQLLERQVSASVPLDTVLIDVTVTDRVPQRAAEIANAVSEQFTRTVADLESTDGRSSPVKVTVVSAAVAPADPVSPSPVRNTGLALFLGLLLAAGLAALRDALDTRVHVEPDLVEITDLAVIGSIDYDADARERPLLVHGDPRGVRAEGFRKLRTNLRFVNVATHPRTMLLTSTVPGEGKTTTAVNLALTMAAGGARVCVVEGDLRRPRMLDYLGLEGAVGLTTVLIGQAGLDDVLQPFGGTTVTALGAGAVPPNPSELLGSAAMRSLLADLADRFDHVIVDAPPLLPVTDAAVLSAVVDGTVLVVGSGMVRREQVARSLAALEAVKGTVLGLVLNLVPGRPGAAYGYYAYPAERATGSVASRAEVGSAR